MNIKDLLHKRILIVSYHAILGKHIPIEYSVDEISPSGEWVKVSDDEKNPKWINSKEILTCEVLGESTRFENKDSGI